MTRKRSLATIAAVSAFTPAWVACAQDARQVQRLERQLQQFDQDFRLTGRFDRPIDERLYLDVGASLRFGFYSIDDEESEPHILRQTDGQLYLRAELDGAHRVYGRLRFLYNDWNSGDAFDERGDNLEHPVGDRYWYEFDLRGAVRSRTGETISDNLRVRVGRQYVHWNDGVALSLPLYAAIAEVELDDLTFRGLAGFTPQEEVIDFDGSRPGFDTETQRAFFGGQLEYEIDGHRPFVYLLSQVDNNDQDFVEFQGGGNTYPTEFEYDSFYLGFGSSGTLPAEGWSYSAEVVHAFGRGRSNSFDDETLLPVEQTTEDIDAWAGVLNFTRVFDDAGASRFDIEFIAGTGDDDRVDSSDTFGGNRPGTDDEAFNAFGFLDTGLALGPEPGNLFSLRLGASTNPFPGTDLLRDFRVGVDGYMFLKLDRNAPVTFATEAETMIGGEIDVGVDWRVFSDLFVTMRYGVFFPGDAMPEGEDDIRQFFYAGVTYAF